MRRHPIVADLIRVRKERGLSQADLGELTHRSQQAVAHFEADPGGRHLLLVEEIAASLGMRLALVPDEQAHAGERS